MKKSIKRIVLCTAIIAGAVIVLAAGFFGFLTIAEYRPADIETLEINNPVQRRPATGLPISILSWNIGYASLDESQDFFMDGGKNIRPASSANVTRNISAIKEFIHSAGCDIVIVQEADIRSRRSYYVDQRAYLAENFSGSSAFAYNFRCAFVPFPFPEFIGRVSSGLLTLNSFDSVEALRLSLSNPFSWPVRTANLKRCLLVSRIPLEDSAAELVLVNLHLEAYDSSGGREAQTAMLLDFLYSEYAKGNYCVAGGDFNQNFPGIDAGRFAIKNSDYFVPGTLKPSLLAEGWRFAADTQTPSCHLLNEPYSGDPDTTQLYVIDGFILSPNVEPVSVQTVDMGFKYSDHNPVQLEIKLK
ncbi:endonuclease subunit UvrC [Spirochaetia bacterium]|nr:endonuclease subunit UvrC [Spirochaetia bacterium]